MKMKPKIFIARDEWEKSWVGSKLELTNLFWDCECEKNYIHSHAENQCPICKALDTEQPDSRVREVLLADLIELVEPYEPREAMNIGSQYGAMEMLYAFERAGLIHAASPHSTQRMLRLVSKATDIPTLRTICDQLATAIKKGKYQ